MNKHVKAILGLAEETAELINGFYIPVKEGEKSINDKDIDEENVETWIGLKEQVIEAIEETELAWAIAQESDEEVESDEE